jgi:hypothetical protein
MHCIALHACKNLHALDAMHSVFIVKFSQKGPLSLRITKKETIIIIIIIIIINGTKIST